MRYGYGNGIGALLSIAVGVLAFAGWLYASYPATATALADESRRSWSFLVLAGFVVVAVIGVAIAGTVLQGLMTLLKSLVQLAVIVALVAGGVVLWQRHRDGGAYFSEPTVQPTAAPTRSAPPSPPPAVDKRRWWEQTQ